MAITTFKEYLSGGVESKATTSKTLSFAEYIANAEPSKPTLGSKAGNIAKALAVGIAKPVVTSVARPIQLGAELLGATAEQVDRVSAKVPGGLVAPVPRNFQDVKKDIGRGIETAALALPVSKLSSLGRLAPFVPKSTTGQLIAGGAGFGLGASLEEGNKLFSKETAISTGLGGITGGILGVAGKTYRSFKDFQKTPAQYTEEALKRADFGPIPQAPQRALTTVPGRGVVDKTPIALPEAGVLKGQQALRDIPQVTPPVKPSTPQATRAKATASRDDFVASERKLAETPKVSKEEFIEGQLSKDVNKKFTTEFANDGIEMRRFQWFSEWLASVGKMPVPPADVVKHLSKFKPNKPVTLYRGVTKGGEDIGGAYQSWARSKATAQEFSKDAFKGGKVESRVFAPDEILTDTTLWSSKMKKDLYGSKIRFATEQEVIVKGNKISQLTDIWKKAQKTTVPKARRQTTAQLAKIWDEQHATPKALPQKKAVVKETIKKTEGKTEPKKTEGKTESKETKAESKKETTTEAKKPAKAVTEKELNEADEVIARALPKEDDWTNTTLKEQYSRFVELLGTDKERLIQIAMDSSTTDKLRNNWALSFLENYAKKTKDTALSTRLSYSKIGSRAGGELVGGRFKDKSTPASIFREVRKSRADEVGMTPEVMKKHSQALVDKFQKLVDDLKGRIPTEKEINKIIDSIICK